MVHFKHIIFILPSSSLLAASFPDFDLYERQELQAFRDNLLRRGFDDDFDLDLWAGDYDDEDLLWEEDEEELFERATTGGTLPQAKTATKSKSANHVSGNSPSNKGGASGGTVDYSSWKPAGPGDSRGPCPGLNSLANHGILPHNGKSLTVNMIVNATTSALNLGSDLATGLASGALAISPNPKSGKFNLADLIKHNAIEHDASLSRADASKDPSQKFSPAVWKTTLSHFTSPTITLKQAASARAARSLYESKNDHSFTFQMGQFIISNAETALYLMAMGNGNSAPLKYVRVLFEEERLPFKEGWRPSKTPIDVKFALTNIAKVIGASNDAGPQGLSPSETKVMKAIADAEKSKGDATGMLQKVLDQYGIKL